MLRPFWISWWEDPTTNYEMNNPWWNTNPRMTDTGHTQLSVTAAVMAHSEEHAMEIIEEAHDEEVELEWRFIEEKPFGWTPFVIAPQASWMVWDQKPH